MKRSNAFLRRKRKNKQNRKNGTIGADYGTYIFSARERILFSLEYLLLDILIGWLFFQSWIACLILLPGVLLFLKEKKKQQLKARQDQMLGQFLTGMQLVGNCLQTGYSVENAFRESLSELLKIYGEEEFIVCEFRLFIAQSELNRPAEELLRDIGRRSHLEDIENFGEIFATARRSGGDLIAITKNTVSSIRQKQETEQEIMTELTGKIMEQKIMSIVPLGILAYITLTSADFLSGMYHNPAGILVMSICLILYAVAWGWGRRIVQIKI